MPDLQAAFDLLYARYGTNYPSFATFITGPSRTGDIELILVLGAHGPRNLTVILIRRRQARDLEGTVRKISHEILFWRLFRLQALKVAVTGAKVPRRS